MSDAPRPIDETIHLKVQAAITRALREEKQSGGARWLRVILATVTSSLVFTYPFFHFYRDQMNLIWELSLSAWVVYFFIGFYFFFRPQTRLLVRGVWSPHVIARVFLVSTFATLLQILLCPSFVFLESSGGWNPLLPMTQYLMHAGGMALCMGFCGFLFSAVAGGLGFWSIYTVARGRDLRTSIYLFSILTLAQIPVICVQVGNPELRPFALFWITGILLGFALIKIFQSLAKKLES